MCPFVAAYVGFMWMLLLVAYSERDPNAFFLNQHIRNSFSGQISDSMNLGDVFIWAKTSLLNNLFGVYPGKNVWMYLHHYIYKISIILSLSLRRTGLPQLAWLGTVDSCPAVFEKRRGKTHLILIDDSQANLFWINPLVGDNVLW